MALSGTVAAAAGLVSAARGARPSPRREDNVLGGSGNGVYILRRVRNVVPRLQGLDENPGRALADEAVHALAGDREAHFAARVAIQLALVCRNGRGGDLVVPIRTNLDRLIIGSPHVVQTERELVVAAFHSKRD